MTQNRDHQYASGTRSVQKPLVCIIQRGLAGQTQVRRIRYVFDQVSNVVQRSLFVQTLGSCGYDRQQYTGCCPSSCAYCFIQGQNCKDKYGTFCMFRLFHDVVLKGVLASDIWENSGNELWLRNKLFFILKVCYFYNTFKFINLVRK